MSVGSQTRITKRVMFCAAHHIPGAGKCEQNHGHNWVANITVDQIGGELDSRGFIVDVRDLKETAFKYDHDDLNKYFEYPSTEHVAQTIANDALKVCVDNNPEGVFIVGVHLIETENNTAHATASNFVAGLGKPEERQVPSLTDQAREAHAAEAAWAYGGATIPPAKSKFIKRSA